MEFPLIDLNRFETGSPEERRGFAKRVDDICKSIGFVAVTGHGVSQDLLEEVWRGTREFFDLSLAEKLKVRPPLGDPYGYFPPDTESLARSLGDQQPADLKESFNIGPLERPSYLSSLEEAKFCYAENHWPAKPQGFRSLWLRYYQAMDGLAQRIMSLFAVALELPADFFADKIDQPISAIRILNYPDMQTQPLPGQLRAGAHTDYGSLTILLPDAGQGGLEIQTRTGQWHPVPTVEDAFVINIGDLMARWTNDRWVSTMHRVVNPPQMPESNRRQSIVFFHQPNWDAQISCIDTCLDPGQSPKYPSITSGKHLMQKFTDTVVKQDAKRS